MPGRVASAPELRGAVFLSPYHHKGTKQELQTEETEAEVLQASCALWRAKHPYSQKKMPIRGTVSLESLRVQQLQEVERVKRRLGMKGYQIGAGSVEAPPTSWSQCVA